MLALDKLRGERAVADAAKVELDGFQFFLAGASFDKLCGIAVGTKRRVGTKALASQRRVNFGSGTPNYLTRNLRVLVG